MDIKVKWCRYRLIWWAAAALITFAVALCVQTPPAFAGQTGSITLVACTAPANANSSAILPGQTTPIAGDTFTLQKLSDDSAAANANVKAVTVDSTPLSTFAAQTKTTGSDGTVVFSDLERGVYLVTQTPPTGYRAAEQKFMVAIPMADSAATSGENWDVKVYPKLQADKMIAKEVAAAPAVAGVGDEIDWTIHVTIPQDMKIVDAYGVPAYSTDWAIYDDFSTCVDYLGADSTASGYKASVLEIHDSSGSTVATLVAGTDYTEAYEATTRRVTWTLTTTGIQKAADARGGAEIVVTVHTVVNENAYANMTNIFNNAGYTYKDPYGDPHSGKVTPGEPDPNNPDDPHVVVGGLVIDKYLSGTSTKLAGAHFKVATSKENASAGKFLTITVDGNATDIELVTDANGAASLGGLGSGTYYLKETKTPTFTDDNGDYITCMLLTDPVQVTVSSDTSKHVVTASIANTAPSSTSGGAIGTISQAASKISNGVKTGDPATWAILVSIIALATFGCIVAGRRRKDQGDPARRTDR